jgi:hypothetical protein
LARRHISSLSRPTSIPDMGCDLTKSFCTIYSFRILSYYTPSVRTCELYYRESGETFPDPR